jgi:hypothetical protein
MNSSDVKADRRRRGQSRPFWSGAAPLGKLSDERGEVASAVAMLPKTRSAPGDIVQTLLHLGSRYHRYLHQDEYGPTRADRSAALLELKKALDTLARRLSKLPTRLKQLLASRLSELNPSLAAPQEDEFTYFEQERESVERILDAALFAIEAKSALTRDRVLFDKLRSAAEDSLASLEGLDTTSEVDVLLAPATYNHIRPSPRIGAGQFIVRARLARLQLRVDLTLKALNRQRGPDQRLSLPWLVEELGDLWSRETGEIVTSSAATGGRYSGVPQSAAGRFILASVEALQPSRAWLEQHEHMGASVSAMILNASSGYRARVVNNILADYVARRPSMKRRGRRKKAVQTF